MADIILIMKDETVFDGRVSRKAEKALRLCSRGKSRRKAKRKFNSFIVRRKNARLSAKEVH